MYWSTLDGDEIWRIPTIKASKFIKKHSRAPVCVLYTWPNIWLWKHLHRHWLTIIGEQHGVNFVTSAKTRWLVLTAVRGILISLSCTMETSRSVFAIYFISSSFLFLSSDRRPGTMTHPVHNLFNWTTTEPHMNHVNQHGVARALSHTWT